MVFQSVRLASIVPPGGMARLAGHSRWGFLAQPSLAVLARGGPLTGRIPDPVQLDAARLLRSASGRGQRQAVVALLSKGDLGLLRFANVLALALLVAHLIHPQARFLASQAARPFVICGRNSLHIFCLGILLSVLGELVLDEFFGAMPIQFGVSAAGLAIT